MFSKWEAEDSKLDCFYYNSSTGTIYEWTVLGTRYGLGVRIGSCSQVLPLLEAREIIEEHGLWGLGSTAGYKHGGSLTKGGVLWYLRGPALPERWVLSSFLHSSLDWGSPVTPKWCNYWVVVRVFSVTLPVVISTGVLPSARRPVALSWRHFVFFVGGIRKNREYLWGASRRLSNRVGLNPWANPKRLKSVTWPQGR